MKTFSTMACAGLVLSGCSGAFAVAVDFGDDASPDAPARPVDASRLPDGGLSDVAWSREAAAMSEAEAEAADTAAGPSDDAATAPDTFCAPATPALQSFNCPVGGNGGIPVPLDSPTYYTMADVNQCSYAKTPFACLCAQTYTCACLEEQGVCSNNPTVAWASCSTVDGLLYVTCKANPGG